MSEEKFFRMEDIYSSFAHAIELKVEKKIVECPKCGAIESIRLEPIKVYFEGKKQGDFYYVTKGSIISSRLQKILHEENVTGFTLGSINVEGWYDSNGKILPIAYDDLKELKVTGKCGYLRHDNGELLDKCDQCDNFDYDKAEDEVEGLSVNLDEWDGSDMFQFKNWSGVIIVTEKVKEIIENNKLKSIKFTDISEITFD
ncbi:hypothetical protein [Clostridium estertheticum]|uniref:Uncharacterized protein n=1 Tax=Clostridium estertheticum TaxID=238834 RepID=A0A5N7J886_9CLOT|nr:hypothetical protein [Clostridium estertheticum]MBU3185954.1 hypothetical protein [Clostridium estertheticum]MPQ31640.1 hypothetical protein [Clostridium estertheticum]MPQ64958.1 hypothetical protein [Clostridium estertheticum]